MRIHWIASKIDLLDDQHQVFVYKNQQVDFGWTFSGKGYMDKTNTATDESVNPWLYFWISYKVVIVTISNELA